MAFVQINESGFSFQALTQARMSLSMDWTDRWSLRRRRSSVTKPKNRSPWLIQEEYVGAKCMWNLRCISLQAFTAGVLWGWYFRRLGARPGHPQGACKVGDESACLNIRDESFTGVPSSNFPTCKSL